MTKHFAIVSMVLILISTQACNNFKQNSWALTYGKVDDFTGKTLIKIGTKDCYYEAETGIKNETAKIKWESTSEKLKTLFEKIAAHQLQNSIVQKADEKKISFETLELVQNDTVVFSIQKNQLTKPFVRHFEEVVILIRTFSMEEQGWKF